MARTVRWERSGAWYHVTARGNERRAIYRDDHDRRRFLSVIEEFAPRFAVRVHAFVLMDNHFHLMIETREANLSRAMQWLNVSYSVWFNRRHRRSGHLFQGRFQAIVVEAERYALELSRYVHLNPVRVRSLGLDKAAQRQRRENGVSRAEAAAVRQRLERLREYRWSSYRAYAGWERAPGWLQCETVLGLMGIRGSEEERRRRYRQYAEEAVRDGLEETPWERLQAGVLLGEAEFVRRMKRWMKGDAKEQPAVRRLESRPTFAQVTAAVARARGERWERFRDRHGDWGRDAALYLGRARGGMKLRELGEAVGGIDYRSVGTAVRRFQERLKKEKEMAKRIAGIEEQLKNEEM